MTRPDPFGLTATQGPRPATLDRLHHEPALALAEQGYHLLLEKPMAVTPDMCRSVLTVG